ncbi:DEP domain-containing protein 1B isoform X2 [Rhinatrema bivittatum]|uniref:DEP domain-containing protein 1B isoform X2 n=1 Tax=Rhinatrema bivittatum TaxID=194408 RepID=UPI00112B794B|nr:DEP domain-containing protein 1B isoform X2 [Rhinatrema bivittatum]
MEHKIIGPGPYRATKLWNETIELFRAGMSLRKHRVHFKTYENCFSASEAIEYLNDLLRCNQNFGPEVSRNQTIQLLKKFLKNHVIEDVKGRWGKEDFEDNGCLYRFPPSSPLRPFPKKPLYRFERLKFPGWEDTEPEISQENIPVEPIMNSLWYKRHSIAIGEVPASRLICRRELTDANIEEIWKSMTLSHLQKILGLDSLKDVLDAKLVNPKHVMFNVYNTNKQGVVVLEDKSEELPHWMLSAMKCLANWPNFSDVQHPMYVGFERDVFKTIADYHIHLKEPLLTFQLFDAFVNILALSGFVSLPEQSSQRESTQRFPVHVQQYTSGNGKRHVFSSSVSIENLMLSLSKKKGKLYYPDTIPKLLTRSESDKNCWNTRDKRDPRVTCSQHLFSSNSTHVIPCSKQQKQSNQSSIYRPSVLQCPPYNLLKTSVPCSEENIYPKMNHGGSLQNLRGFRDEVINPWISTYRHSSIETFPDICKLERKHSLPHFASVSNFAVKHEKHASVENWNRSQSVHYLPTLYEISMPSQGSLFSHCKSCKDKRCPGFTSLVHLKEDDEETMQGVLQKRQVAIEALQVCCLLLPPENRRKLQLLMRMMARISLNKEMPSLSDTVGNRMLIKYPDSDMAAGLPTHSFCPQIAADEFEFQKANHDQKPLETLLEEIIVNKKLSVKDKKKKLKQFQKSYPGTYKERFPTPESEAAVFPEKRKLKPPLLFFTLKKPFQPFQRTRSFRM